MVFNRVYRLEIQSVKLIFSIGFVNYCPTNLLFSLVSSPPPPPPCCNKYSTVYCKGGGGSKGS
jgi:hypothetical protein